MTHPFPNGTWVMYASTRAEVLRSERKYGQDGYRVWDEPPGDWGATRPYPRWVPATSVRLADDPRTEGA